MVEPRLKAGSRLLPEGLSFAWQASDACVPSAEGHAPRADRAGRSPVSRRIRGQKRSTARHRTHLAQLSQLAL